MILDNLVNCLVTEDFNIGKLLRVDRRISRIHVWVVGIHERK